MHVLVNHLVLSLFCDVLFHSVFCSTRLQLIIFSFAFCGAVTRIPHLEVGLDQTLALPDVSASMLHNGILGAAAAAAAVVIHATMAYCCT